MIKTQELTPIQESTKFWTDVVDRIPYQPICEPVSPASVRGEDETLEPPKSDKPEFEDVYEAILKLLATKCLQFAKDRNLELTDTFKMDPIRECDPRTLAQMNDVLTRANLMERVDKTRLTDAILHPSPTPDTPQLVLAHRVYSAIGRKVDCLIRIKLVRENCYGCTGTSSFLPSQDDHDVCLLEREEQISRFLDTAVGMIDAETAGITALIELMTHNFVKNITNSDELGWAIIERELIG